VFEGPRVLYIIVTMLPSHACISLSLSLSLSLSRFLMFGFLFLFIYWLHSMICCGRFLSFEFIDFPSSIPFLGGFSLEEENKQFNLELTKVRRQLRESERSVEILKEEAVESNALKTSFQQYVVPFAVIRACLHVPSGFFVCCSREHGWACL
jgi:hypothetical protein